MKNRCQNLMPWEPPEMGSMDTTQCGCCCCCCGSIKILILHCLAMVARDIDNGEVGLGCVIFGILCLKSHGKTRGSCLG